MIVKKVWDSKKGYIGFGGFRPKYTYIGLFLLGIIPLFVIRETNY